MREGLDGWLFHSGHKVDWEDYLGGKRLLSLGVQEDWMDHHVMNHCAMGHVKIDYHFLIIPEKHCLCASYLPEEIRTTSFTPLAQISKGLLVCPGYIDLHSVFASLGPSTFLKKDSHWSPFGAHEAIRAIATRLDFLVREFEVSETADVEQYEFGDLTAPWEMCRKKVNDAFLPLLATKIFKHVEGNISGIMQVKNQSADLHKTLLIFGNSFVEYFFINMISYHFCNIIFVFSHHVDLNIVNKINPDVVFHITNERFLPVSPKTTSVVPLSARFARKCLNTMHKPQVIDLLRFLPGGYRGISDIFEQKDVINEKTSKNSDWIEYIFAFYALFRQHGCLTDFVNWQKFQDKTLLIMFSSWYESIELEKAMSTLHKEVK